MTPFPASNRLLPGASIACVYAQMSTQVHGTTRGDDNAPLVLEFDNGTVCLAEGSGSV